MYCEDLVLLCMHMYLMYMHVCVCKSFREILILEDSVLFVIARGGGGGPNSVLPKF